MQNNTQNKRQFWSLTTRCKIILATKDSSGSSPPDVESYLEQKTVLEPHHQMQNDTHNKRLCWRLTTRCKIILTKDSSGASPPDAKSYLEKKRQFCSHTTRCKVILRTKDSSGATPPDAVSYSGQKTVLELHHQMQNYTQNKRQFWSLTTRCKIILATKDSSGASPPDVKSYLEQKTVLVFNHQMYNHNTVLKSHHQMQRYSRNKRQFWNLSTRCRIILRTKDSSGASPPHAESYLQQKTVLELHHQMLTHTQNQRQFWIIGLECNYYKWKNDSFIHWLKAHTHTSCIQFCGNGPQKCNIWINKSSFLRYNMFRSSC